MDLLEIPHDTSAAIEELEGRDDKEIILKEVEKEFIELGRPPLTVVKKLKNKFQISSLAATALIRECQEQFEISLNLKAEYSSQLALINNQLADLQEILIEQKTLGGEAEFAIVDIINSMKPLIDSKAKLLEQGMKLNLFSAMTTSGTGAASSLSDEQLMEMLEGNDV